MNQPALPGLREFDPCRRCGQEPKVRYWEPLGAKEEERGMDVSCACRTISGDIDGMAAAWNRAASRLREDD